MSDPSSRPAPLLRAAAIAAAEQTFSHPWNPHSEIRGARLAAMAGMQRSGVSLARIPPGKESFAYHSHHCEEEWVYVLAGRGVAHIDGQRHEIGPGDFLGFPTPSVAHQLANPFGEDLVYLMGGEARDVEVADFPELGRRMIRRGNVVETLPLDALKPFPER